MTGASFSDPPDWRVDPADPNDEYVGQAVDPITPDDAGEYDAVIVGEPYDGAVISRRGAAEGPVAIRESLRTTKRHHFDAGPLDRIGDVGDVVVPDGPVSTVQDALADAAATIHESEAVPVFLGGDNSTTYANAAPLLADGSGDAAVDGSVGAISFDAHLDCREVRGEPTSGSPYRQLFAEGLAGFACVGARHFETSTAYHEFVREQGGGIVTAEEVGDDPVDAINRAFDALRGVDAVYVSVDIDVLDAPYDGASAPTPGGLTPRELFRLVRLAASDNRVAGFEIVETAPSLDTGGRTVDAAARTVAHFLAGWSA